MNSVKDLNLVILDQSWIDTKDSVSRNRSDADDSDFWGRIRKLRV